MPASSGRVAASGLDSNLRFVEPRAAAGRALAGLEEPILSKGEPACTAAGGFDDDGDVTRPGGSDEMTKIVFDVAPGQAQIARERGNTARLGSQQGEEVAAEGHAARRERSGGNRTARFNASP
jgi:hypothetical protein